MKRRLTFDNLPQLRKDSDDLEMDIELSKMEDNSGHSPLSVVNPLINNETNNSQNQLDTSTNTPIHDDTYSSLKFVYAVIIHTIIFSVFESLFFWFYVAKSEEDMIRNNLFFISSLVDTICLNFPTDSINLDPITNYIESDINNSNIHGSIQYTFVLNGGLICLGLLMNIVFCILRLDLKMINKKVFKESFIIMILLFAYEYVFFRCVVYNYKPVSMAELAEEIISPCR